MKKLILSSFLGTLFGAGIVFFLLFPMIDFDEQVLTEETQDTESIVEQIIKTSSLSTIDQIYDATVFVENFRYDELYGTGSGFIYKTDENYAYILTNHHVIEDSHDIKIMFASGKEVNAELISSDDIVDIAVLKMNKDNVTQVAKMGDSDLVVLGEKVITVGSPLGEKYLNTVTQGYISGLNRFIDLDTDGVWGVDWKIELIQTDAAINPGNSGGPLVNMDGEVIGINTIKFSSTEVEAMGFSIPINQALDYANELEEYGEVIRPTFGIQFQDFNLNGDNIKANYPVDYGIVILATGTDMPAAKAGIEADDLIVSVNGVTIENGIDFRYELFKSDPGDEIIVEFYRGTELMKTTVLLDDSDLEDLANELKKDD